MSNFESFSEDLIPRIVPQPTLHPVLDMPRPTVPEVSFILEKSKKYVLNKVSHPKSYKEWKDQQKQQQPSPALQQQKQPPGKNFVPHQALISDRKKIVKFHLPTNPEKKVLSRLIESAACQQLDLSLCDTSKLGDIGGTTISPNYLTETPCQSSNRMNTDKLASNNVTIKDVYQLLQNMHLKNHSSGVININQNELNLLNEQRIQSRQQSDQPSLVPRDLQLCANNPTTNNEPTMKEMLSVILKQQEQLMNVQNQVHVLLERSAKMNPNYNYNNNGTEQMLLNDSIDNVNHINSHTKQVGVMTSLEINVQNFKPIKTQSSENFNTPHKIKRNQIAKLCGCMCNCESQKQLQSLDCKPSDDNFNTSPNKDGVRAQTGWTFYGNILNQVNDVLQNTSPISSSRGIDTKTPQMRANRENNLNGLSEFPNKWNSNVMPNIHRAQFKQVGFQIDDVNISAMAKRITFGSSSNEIPQTPADRIVTTDKSMMMNALAMKYLPYDFNNSQSRKLVQNETICTTSTNAYNEPVEATRENSTNWHSEFDGRNTRTDMSMTSYRYMKKYGLL